MKKENRNRDDYDTHGLTPVGSPNSKPPLISAHLGVTKQTLRHIEVITQHLQQQSTLLDLVAIQLYQQLIVIYGEELDQQMTSDTILTDIKNLVETHFKEHNLWEASAKEIWSSLVLRTIQDMQRDLGNSVLESLDWEAFNRILFQYLFDNQSVTIDNRIRYLEEFYAQDIATKIVQDLNLHHQSIFALKRLLGLQADGVKTPAPTLENELSKMGPIAEIPSELPIISREDSTGKISFSDQFQTDLWQSDARSIAYLRYHSKHNRNHYLEHYIASPSDIEVLPWETADQMLNKFGLNAVKLHFILTAYAMQQKAPWYQTFKLTVGNILQRLGWDYTRRTELINQRHQVTHLAYALSCLLVKFVWMDGQTSHSGVHTPVGKLWDILITPYGEFDWTTGRIENPTDIQLTVRTGMWAIDFLNQAGEQTHTALNKFGRLALKLLQLDAYSHDLALRLIIHLMLDTRIQASHPSPYNYQVKMLLSTVLSEEIIQHAQTNTEIGHSLFESWNRALTLFTKLGWHPERNDAQGNSEPESNSVFYVSPYPKWLDPERNVKKPRGWISTWLEQRLVIRPL